MNTDCALPEVCPDHVHDLPATTIAAGLPLTSGSMTKPPLNIPGDDGRPYKTELVVSRASDRTVKINWWHGPDDGGARARPHNHPWDFTSTVLHGAITHTRYLSGRGGDHPRILTRTETIRAGESYTVLAYEYHAVTAVEPGTVTMMTCGPLGGTEPHGDAWGYLDTETGDHVPATPDPEFRARLAAANPWMAVTRYAVVKVEDVPVTAHVTWARNRHGTIHEMAEKLNSGALDPASLSWIRRPIGRDLYDIRGVLCVVDAGSAR